MASVAHAGNQDRGTETNWTDWTGLTEMGHLMRPVRTDVGRVPSRLRMGIRMAQTCPQCGYEANERLAFAALHSQ